MRATVCVAPLLQVFREAFQVHISMEVWIAIVLPLVILCCWIRDLDNLTPFSLVANLCILFSISVIFYQIIFRLASDHGDQEAAVNKGEVTAFYFVNFPLFFGSAVFAFEGIGMVGSHWKAVSLFFPPSLPLPLNFLFLSHTYMYTHTHTLFHCLPVVLLRFYL